ncbi:hypothetical protein L6452_36197 [Arctium lappa]|uniref:Uncharacterized protein n=1 Tax=Arctium lappa TaxID=4217 RepID=A0ACB8Y7U2_ARCLA|nr:hypothetical protein L6452_36197 [Arctium lappa]
MLGPTVVSELKGKISEMEAKIQQTVSVESNDQKVKQLESENVELQRRISNLEQTMVREKSDFETEIKRLTSKLSELSASALKEQKTKSEFSKKIDQLVKERDIFASKIKELEKSASSSNQKSVSSQRSVKSFNQIRRSNIFFDEYIDGSDTSSRRKSYKKQKLVWMKKSDKDDKKDELKKKTSCVHAHKAKKSKAHNGKKYYCSICCTHDHTHKTSDHFWYGSYSITTTRTATNISGPKYQWVAKKKTDFLLQATQVKGE